MIQFLKRHPFIIGYCILLVFVVFAMVKFQQLNAASAEDDRLRAEQNEEQIHRICESSAETRAAVRQLVQFATTPAATTPEDDAADRERIRIANERRTEFRAAAENIIGDPDCLGAK